MIPENLNTLPPEIRSRYIKTKIPCPNCGTIMAERRAGKWEFMIRNGHRVSKVVFELGKTSGVEYKVKCPNENCNGELSFDWIYKTLTASHSVDVVLAKDPVHKDV